MAFYRRVEYTNVNRLQGEQLNSELLTLQRSRGSSHGSLPLKVTKREMNRKEQDFNCGVYFNKILRRSLKVLLNAFKDEEGDISFEIC